MQIIDELEVHKRGPYGGGIGHVSFTGEMTCRTTEASQLKCIRNCRLACEGHVYLNSICSKGMLWSRGAFESRNVCS